jgi:hypothetical protein
MKFLALFSVLLIVVMLATAGGFVAAGAFQRNPHANDANTIFRDLANRLP